MENLIQTLERYSHAGIKHSFNLKSGKPCFGWLGMVGDGAGRALDMDADHVLLLWAPGPFDWAFVDEEIKLNAIDLNSLEYYDATLGRWMKFDADAVGEPRAKPAAGKFSVAWDKCAADFAGDGSLRDICVRGAGMAGWDALLRISVRYGGRFYVGGEPRPFPESAHGFFADDAPGPLLLLLHWKGVELAAHFSDPFDVKMNFMPDSVDEQERLDDLCAFLRILAAATGREVTVTPENRPRRPLLRVQPEGGVLRA